MHLKEIAMKKEQFEIGKRARMRERVLMKPGIQILKQEKREQKGICEEISNSRSDKNLVIDNLNKKNERQNNFPSLQNYYKFENEQENQEQDTEQDETESITNNEQFQKLKIKESSDQLLLNKLNDSQSKSPLSEQQKIQKEEIKDNQQFFNLQQQPLQESKENIQKIDIQIQSKEVNLNQENLNKEIEIKAKQQIQVQNLQNQNQNQEEAQIIVTKEKIKNEVVKSQIQVSAQKEEIIQIEKKQEIQTKGLKIEPTEEIKKNIIEVQLQKEVQNIEAEIEVKEELQNKGKENPQLEEQKNIEKITYYEEVYDGSRKGNYNYEKNQQHEVEVDLAAWVNEMEPSIDDYSETYSQKNDESFFRNLIQENKEEEIEVVEIQKEVIQIEQTIQDGKIIDQRESQKSLGSEIKFLKKGESQQIISQYQNQQGGNFSFKSEENQISPRNKQIEKTIRVQKEDQLFEFEDKSERSVISQASSQNSEQIQKSSNNLSIGRKISSPQAMTKKK